VLGVDADKTYEIFFRPKDCSDLMTRYSYKASGFMTPTVAQSGTNTLSVKLKGMAGDTLSIVAGGTDTHVMLVDLTSKDITGKEAQNLLDEVNITANRNTIPFEPRRQFVTSGIRLGSPALTTRGFKEEDMREVARIIAHVLDAPADESRRTEARARVDVLCKKYPLYE